MAIKIHALLNKQKRVFQYLEEKMDQAYNNSAWEHLGILYTYVYLYGFK